MPIIEDYMSDDFNKAVPPRRIAVILTDGFWAVSAERAQRYDDTQKAIARQHQREEDAKKPKPAPPVWASGGGGLKIII